MIHGLGVEVYARDVKIGKQIGCYGEDIKDSMTNWKTEKEPDRAQQTLFYKF